MNFEKVFANAVISGLIDAKTNASIPDIQVNGDLASLMQFAELTIEDYELDNYLSKAFGEDSNDQ